MLFKLRVQDISMQIVKFAGYLDGKHCYFLSHIGVYERVHERGLYSISVVLILVPRLQV